MEQVVFHTSGFDKNSNNIETTLLRMLVSQYAFIIRYEYPRMAHNETGTNVTLKCIISI